MKRLTYLLLFMVLSYVGNAQARPLQYQSTYIPKSDGQLMLEAMAPILEEINNKVQKAKNHYIVEKYEKALELALDTEKLTEEKLGRGHVAAMYIAGKCYQKTNSPDKAKIYLDYARKNGLTTDKQLYALLKSNQNY